MAGRTGGAAVFDFTAFRRTGDVRRALLPAVDHRNLVQADYHQHRLFACRACGARMGEPCISKTGRICSEPHADRERQLGQAVEDKLIAPALEWERRHTPRRAASD